MLGSLLQPHIWTANLVFIGIVARPDRGAHRDGHRARVPVEPGHQLRGRRPRRPGRRAARRSWRARRDWPYWPSLVLARRSPARSPGTVVELAVIRRLFKAPRVIVLVATIGVARAGAGGHPDAPELPHRVVADRVPEPDHRASGIDRRASRSTGRAAARADRRAGHHGRAVVAARPHPRSAISVRASATNADLARLTGISPKLVSTAIWTIAGFLSAVVDHPATRPSRARPSSSRSGRRRCCSGCPPRSSAACVVPAAVAGAIAVGVLVPGARLQLPEHRRARAVRGVHPRARARRPHEPRRRRRRRELLVRAARPAGPRAPARDLVGAAHAAAARRARAARRDRRCR